LRDNLAATEIERLLADGATMTEEEACSLAVGE
jgi:hypothetical protein